MKLVPLTCTHYNIYILGRKKHVDSTHEKLYLEQAIYSHSIFQMTYDSSIFEFSFLNFKIIFDISTSIHQNPEFEMGLGT